MLLSSLAEHFCNVLLPASGLHRKLGTIDTILELVDPQLASKFRNSQPPIEVHDADVVFCRLFSKGSGAEIELGTNNAAHITEPWLSFCVAKVAYFGVPWLVTLCSQGVAINAAIEVWDVLLNVGVAQHDGKGCPMLNTQFLLSFCVAMLRTVRPLLMESNFAGCMVCHLKLVSLVLHLTSFLLQYCA